MWAIQVCKRDERKMPGHGGRAIRVARTIFASDNDADLAVSETLREPEVREIYIRKAE